LELTRWTESKFWTTIGLFEMLQTTSWFIQTKSIAKREKDAQTP